MAMDNSPVTPISPSLHLKLGQAYKSMLELDLVVFSVLKEIRNSIQCGGISIWLLNEERTVLECTHAVGSDAAKMLGRTTRVKKFTASLKDPTIPHYQWMDTKIYLDFFKLEAQHIHIDPLLARDELIGTMIATSKMDGTPLTENDCAQMGPLSTDIAIAIQNTQLYERRNKVYDKQKLLSQITRHLHQTLDLDELIPRIFAEVNKAINAEGQSIWLVDTAEGVIRCRFATGSESETLKGFSVSLSAPSIVGTSVSKKKPIMIKDAHNDPRRARSADEKTGYITRSLMTVPLVLEDEAIGAIQAVNKRGGQLFNQEDLDLFQAIANTAALAVNNAQLVYELQNSYDLTLDALSAALDLRDRETEGHSRRVVEYTARLAEQIGLDKAAIKNIRRGALIHDIGKIGVPDAILLKPGSLDEEEIKVIKRHPQLGYNMLVGIPYLREEIQIVICHQEKWDGTGYPFGLRGEEIAIGARLFAIADTFDALTSDRPYRKGQSYEASRILIEAESGKQFDPQAVAAFLAVPPEEWLQIRARVMEEIEERRGLKK
jgi:HD-GYP domain-containing protein (c-di-GMP phosphodiesterase class II)